MAFTMTEQQIDHGQLTQALLRIRDSAPVHDRAAEACVYIAQQLLNQFKIVRRAHGECATEEK